MPHVCMTVGMNASLCKCLKDSLIADHIVSGHLLSPDQLSPPRADWCLSRDFARAAVVLLVCGNL